ncbi:hypothetical protein HGH92_24525 [Chitinophaga varians]|uniref:Uncharacterized protein n=1 Tax=Chitinophaga varians TaxID=2202339 RepID=A0A847RWM2_9BACT|nr:hypothetical protein [Chitinophaga varians]NLR67493.1 hypothetical protein [Chitinophaga varians]
MEKLIFVLFLAMAFLDAPAQITIKQIGKVHYAIVPANKPVSLRNDTIAQSINNYIQQHAEKDFPDVLLYINDQDPESMLSNFEQVLVYYQKYAGEFFNKYDDVYRYNRAHIGIEISLFHDHYQKGMEAIEYAVNHLKRLKKKEKRLSRKSKDGVLTEVDLKCFEL